MLDFLLRFLPHFESGILSAFGGIISYLYRLFKDAETWNLRKFFLNAFIAFGTGVMAGPFISSSFWARDGWLLLIGYLCFQILDIIDTHKSTIANFIQKLITK